MKPFQDILVYLGDESTAGVALTRAADLARRHGARLKLVDVLDEVPGFVWDRVSDPDVVRGKHRREQAERLEEAASDAIDRGVEVTTRLLEGKTLEEIIREVLRGGHDLVVKTSQQSFTQDLRFMGTVDRQLTRKCPVPVWLVEPGTERLERIVAAVDLEPGERDLDPLDVRIVDLAAWLAEHEGGRLDVVHALEPWPAAFMRDHFTPERARELEAERREDAVRSLRAVLDGAGCEVPDDRIHVLDGAPGEVVPRFTREHDASLLVMGTLSSAASTGRLIGSAAEAILLHAGCSVLSVKPQGFVSPITPDREAGPRTGG